MNTVTQDLAAPVAIPPFVANTFGQTIYFERDGGQKNVQQACLPFEPQRVLLVCSARAEELALQLAAEVPVQAVFGNVREHVPEHLADEAAATAREVRADLIVSVGGGSTTGTGKAVALRTGLPLVAVPTTLSGSEVTPVWGVTHNRIKTTGRDVRVLPRAVVYDPALLDSLLPAMRVTSAMNALAHCFDSFWAPNRSPIADSMATAGAINLVRGLRLDVADQQRAAPDASRRQATDQLSVGSMLGGMAFAQAGSGLHHKICHVLGGAFDLPHAATHAAVLPWVVALNAPASPAALSALALLDVEDADQDFRRLIASLGATVTLSELELSLEELIESTDQVLASAPKENPVPLTAELVSDLLESAWRGHHNDQR